MDPYEAMVLAEGSNFRTPSQEFGRAGAGTVTQELFEEQLAKGRKEMADKRALAKARTAERTKGDLGGPK
jgi:hypothetical protein